MRQIYINGVQIPYRENKQFVNSQNIILILLVLFSDIYKYMEITQYFKTCSWSYSSWSYNYRCNQCLSTLKFWVRTWRGVHDTTLCDKVCKWLATGRWFSPATPVSSTNTTDHHDISEIFLKVALITILLTLLCTLFMKCWFCYIQRETTLSYISLFSATCGSKRFDIV